MAPMLHEMPDEASAIIKAATQAAPPLIAPEPEHCPGPESESAGKADSCAGCPNQAICASAPKGPDPDVEVIADRLAEVKRKILVLSGKGGVGKSTFSSLLARSFALREEHRADNSDHVGSVGLMDADITGPSIPSIMGAESESFHVSGSGWEPVWVTDNLGVMSIGFMLPRRDEAIIWRGPKKNGLIKQFLKDVTWGSLEWLIIDTPPGTSDEHLSVTGLLGAAGVDGAVLVTTPQEVALLDVRKEIDFCRKAKIPILGIVENMSGFVCPKCTNETQVFRATTGGGQRLATEMGLRFLGRVPLDPRIGMACDFGEAFTEAYPDSPACKAIEQVVANIDAEIRIARKLQAVNANH